MRLDLDLSRYCAPGADIRGANLYKANGVLESNCDRLADGTWMLKGNAADSFNFVNHPWLVASSIGDQILKFGCDCPEMRHSRMLCEHCAALAYLWMVDVPGASVRETVVFQPKKSAAAAAVARTPAAIKDSGGTKCENTEPAAEKPTPDPMPKRSMKIRLGTNADGVPILWCPNDTEQVFHVNVGIIGTMGTGKTQLAKSLITQLYHARQDNYDGSPLGILIFDYKGDYNETKTDFVRATNARVLKPYRLPYNPLALLPGKSFKPLLPMHTANEFADTISQIYGLGPKQKQLLLECTVEAYRKRRIVPAEPSTWGRPAPTIAQVYEIFSGQTEGRQPDKLTAAMNKLHQFCLFEGDPRRTVPLDALLHGVVVVDISGYDSDIQNIIVAITLNQFYANMHARGSSSTDGKYRQLRSFVMVDEADTFMKGDYSSLRRILKEGREFGVGAILSTQSLSHYVSKEDDYSRYVLTWAVHNVSDLKQKDVEYVFKLQPKSQEILHTYSTIKGLQKHQSVVKLGNDAPETMQNRAFYQICEDWQATGR